MTHLDDGLLRRQHDDPQILTPADRVHLTACDRCRDRADAIGGDADRIAALFADPLPAFDVRAAHGRVVAAAPRRRLPRPVLPLVGAVVAAALIAGIVATPARSLAQSFLDVFQPQTVTAVPVTAGELRTLPHLNWYGRVRAARTAAWHPAPTLTAAEAASGLTLRLPAARPSAVPGDVAYEVISPTTSSFTFSAARARRTARQRRLRLPAMPAALDGSTLSVATGSGVAAVYGEAAGIPALIVGEMRAPTVTTHGASVAAMESYVLSLPGVSPQLAAAIRSIGDPTTVLPIPVPAGLARSQSIRVGGSPGVELTDNTGMGTVVVWEHAGVIHGVAGTIGAGQVVDIAQSLA